jgi:thymidine kinase
MEETGRFLKSLGFPHFRIHHSLNHFDFTKGGRRILVIGPMGSGKTEYSARVWRDSRVALKKNLALSDRVATAGADRREVFFIRSLLDSKRFPDYPDDALAYRGGYEKCGDRIARITGSFDLERVIEANPSVGTWIIDEATFYDERTAYVVKRESESRNLIFIFPTLILNFRKDIFNPSARLLLELSTDIFPLTAYCEHRDCLTDSFYTYRYYLIDREECPAIYFDPLIIIGGDKEKTGPREPNYCTRCDEHHYLPGKEYTYLHLKPFGEQAARGEPENLRRELENIKTRPENSILFRHFRERYGGGGVHDVINNNALKVPLLPEKALIFLFAEQNLITDRVLLQLAGELELDMDYIRERLRDNRRTLSSP